MFGFYIAVLIATAQEVEFTTATLTQNFPKNHGFGCNYDRFGKNGLLDAIIRRTDIRPAFVICDKCTNVWDGYEIIPNLIPISRPTIRDKRQLFRDVKIK